MLFFSYSLTLCLSLSYSYSCSCSCSCSYSFFQISCMYATHAYILIYTRARIQYTNIVIHLIINNNNNNNTMLRKLRIHVRFIFYLTMIRHLHDWDHMYIYYMTGVGAHTLFWSLCAVLA